MQQTNKMMTDEKIEDAQDPMSPSGTLDIDYDATFQNIKEGQVVARATYTSRLRFISWKSYSITATDPESNTWFLCRKRA